MSGLYRNMIALSSLVMIVLGVAIVVVTLVHGLGVGILIGVLFVAAGAGRLALLRRRTVR
jgi:hypothetical protein